MPFNLKTHEVIISIIRPIRLSVGGYFQQTISKLMPHSQMRLQATGTSAYTIERNSRMFNILRSRGRIVVTHRARSWGFAPRDLKSFRNAVYWFSATSLKIHVLILPKHVHALVLPREKVAGIVEAIPTLLQFQKPLRLVIRETSTVPARHLASTHSLI